MTRNGLLLSTGLATALLCALPSMAKAQPCSFPASPSYWGCQTSPIITAQPTDLVLGFRPSLAQGGQGSISLLQITNTITSAQVASILGYTPANRAGDTFTGAVAVGSGGQAAVTLTPGSSTSGNCLSGGCATIAVNGTNGLGFSGTLSFRNGNLSMAGLPTIAFGGATYTPPTLTSQYNEFVETYSDSGASNLTSFFPHTMALNANTTFYNSGTLHGAGGVGVLKIQENLGTADGLGASTPLAVTLFDTGNMLNKTEQDGPAYFSLTYNHSHCTSSTGGGTSCPAGLAYGISGQTVLTPGATGFILVETAGEWDMSVQAPPGVNSAPLDEIQQSWVLLNSHTTGGTRTNDGLRLAVQNGAVPTIQKAFVVGGPGSYLPLPPSGVILTTDPQQNVGSQGNCCQFRPELLTSFVDAHWANFTLQSGHPFISPNFSVDGMGTIALGATTLAPSSSGLTIAPSYFTVTGTPSIAVNGDSINAQLGQDNSFPGDILYGPGNISTGQYQVTQTLVISTNTVDNGGSGGTPGSCTLTDASGVGVTPFQLAGTVSSGGTLFGALSITNAGVYNVAGGNPFGQNWAEVPVTSNCGVVGATVPVGMGALTVSVLSPDISTASLTGTQATTGDSTGGHISLGMTSTRATVVNVGTAGGTVNLIGTVNGGTLNSDISLATVTPPATGGIARNFGTLSLDAVDATQFSSVDPTGALDSAPGINQALAATSFGIIRSVNLPAGTYHLKSPITVGIGPTSQCISGVQNATTLDISTDFQAGQNGVIILNGNGLNSGLQTQPCVMNMKIQEHQPPDAVTTVVTSGVAAGGTSVTLNSVAGFTIGDYLVDASRTGALSQWPQQTASTTITNIVGNVVTFSPAVVAAGSIHVGDSIHAAMPQSAAVALGSCSLTAGSAPCIYPPVIYASGAGLVYIDNVDMDNVWQGYSIYGSGGATQSWRIGTTHVGAINSAIQAGLTANFAQIGVFESWPFGMFAPYLGGGAAFLQNFYNGGQCFKFDRVDAADFNIMQCFAQPGTLTSNWTFGHFNSLQMDTTGGLVANGSSTQWTQFGNVYLPGAGVVNGAATPALQATSGRLYFSNLYLPYSGSASAAIVNTGAQLSIMGGSLTMNNPATTMVLTNGSAAVTNISNTTLLAIGQTTTVPYIQETLGVLDMYDDVVLGGSASNAAIVSMATDDARDYIMNVGTNGGGGATFTFTAPGTLGTYQGQIGPSTFFGTMTGGTLAPAAITGSITSTATLSALNVSGSALLGTGSTQSVTVSGGAGSVSFLNSVAGASSPVFSLTDSGGVVMAQFGVGTAGTQANFLKFNSNTATHNVSLNATGTDSNIGVSYITKGAGLNAFTGPILDAGTKFTTSGCSISSTTGGARAGKFTLGASACSAVITIAGATGATATNGWACSASDQTAPTVLISQSASNQTTATLSIPAGAGATDVIAFQCTGY